MHAKHLVTLALIAGLTFVAVTIGDESEPAADQAAADESTADQPADQPAANQADALDRADADQDNDLDFDDVKAFVACHHSPAKPRDDVACPPALAAKFDLDADGDVDNDDFKLFIKDYDVVNPPHPAFAKPAE